jgi:hypothetical protein
MKRLRFSTILLYLSLVIRPALIAVLLCFSSLGIWAQMPGHIPPSSWPSARHGCSRSRRVTGLHRQASECPSLGPCLTQWRKVTPHDTLRP